MFRGLNIWAIIFAISLFSTITFAYGEPGIPHQFYGSIYIINQSVPDNTVLIATIEGENYSTVTKNGLYGRDPAPIFYVPDPNGDRSGKTIQFSIGGKFAGSYIFENAGYTLFNFNITSECPDGYCIGDETCDSCPDDCGECPEEPFTVTIYSPEEDGSYNNTNIPLKVSANQKVKVWWYTLNSGSTIVFTPNTTINAIEGQNQIFVFAKNYQGQVGSNMVFNFSVELPQPECGNGVKEEGEECDLNNFGGLTCSSYGYNSGSLSCSSDCSRIITDGCYNSGGSSGRSTGSSSRGSSGGSSYIPPVTQNETSNKTFNETSGNEYEENQTEDLNETIVCEEDWSCTVWSECSKDGLQVRTCTDLNNCGTTIKKPKTVQKCVEALTENETSNKNNSFLSITGRFLTSPTGIVSIFGLILAIIVGFLVYQKKFAGVKTK